MRAGDVCVSVCSCTTAHISAHAGVRVVDGVVDDDDGGGMCVVFALRSPGLG